MRPLPLKQTNNQRRINNQNFIPVKQNTVSGCSTYMATTKELVEQINRIFTEGRMEDFMDYLAEDVVWDMYTAASGHSTFNGKAELSKMDVGDMPEHTDFKFTKIIIEDNFASVQGSSTNKKANGEQYESNFCDIYQFEDDKIVKMTSYVVDLK